MPTREAARRVASITGPACAIGISAYILFAPMIRSSSVSSSFVQGGTAVQSASIQSESSWFAAFGPSALKFLLFPVFASILPLLGRAPRHRRILGVISVAALAGYCALAAFSIGTFYLPCVIALFAALLLEAPTLPGNS